ncbi:MAG: histidine-type phosphatase [Bacteroidales bacterium]|nr:histidine-type phosphatase [Bacteroidales bacterium]
MKRLICFFLGAVLLICSAASAEQFPPQEPDRWGVNTHCYEFRPETDTPAPAGYKPVYLSHYGRHGSRTGMKVGDTYERVLSALEQAELTPEGDSLLSEVRQVASCHDGMDGRLTRVGEAEQHELGRRIYERYRPVFRNGSKRVRVELSTVPRSIVSGMCFVQTLTSLQPDLQFSFDTGEKFFAYINNTSSKPARAKITALRDSLNALTVSDGEEFCRRVFKDPAAGLSLIGDPDEFQHLVWKCAGEGKASGVQADMFRHLPESVVRKWWADEIRNLYLCHGNSLEYGAERMELAKPLIRVMMNQAQEALTKGTVCADLKFGHDYPLIATAGWFGLEGVGDRLGWKDLPDAWSDPMNIPFATNLQMVFYRNRKGDVLVKFVYNGRERHLRDLTAVSGPYYRWDEVLKRFLPEE